MYQLNIKKQRFYRTIVILTLFVYLTVLFVHENVVAQSKITIPAGTVVSMRVTQEISPKLYKTGDHVNLPVVYDIIIDDHIVIKAGAIVKAEITQSKARGAVGQPAKMGITIQRVEAVDGTIIPLYGAKVVEGSSSVTSAIVVTILCCVLGLLIKGGDAIIPAGTEIQSEVAGTMQVTVSW